MAQSHDNDGAGVEAVVDATAAEALVRPRRPHDDFSFDELSRRYNFRLTSDHRVVITRLILKECRTRPSPADWKPRFFR